MSNDDFDAAVAASLQPNPAQAARAGFALAADTNPDSYAEARRVARRTGVPVDTVLNMPAEMKRQDAVGSIDFDALARTAPATAALLADVERAKVAHDDVHPLSTIERAIRQLSGGAVEGVGMAAGGLGQLADIGQRNATNAFASIFLPKPMAAGGLTPEALAAPTLGEDWIRAGGAVKGYARGDIMVPAAQQTFLDQVLGGLGQFGGQAAMHIATGGMLSAPLLFAQGADAMAEKVAPDQASAGARDAAILGGAAVTGLTEKYALEKILGPMAVPIKNQLAAALARIGIGAATEGAQEFSENLLQDVLRKALTNRDAEISLGQSAEEGGVGAAVGGIARSIVEAALHVRSRGARREQAAQQAEPQAQMLQQFAELAKASKLAQRDPATFEAFVREAAEDGPVKDVFIGADALMQSGMADMVAQAVPEIAQQVQVAAATGGDIRIPVELYASRIATTDAGAALLDHLKTEPGGMSRAEAQGYMEQHQEALQQEVERALQEKEGDDTFRASHEAVKQEIRAQLDTAGRFKSDANEAYATLAGSFYAVQAARLGITPQELYQRYPLKVAAQGVVGEALNQPMTAGFAWEHGQRPGLFSLPDRPVTVLRGDELGGNREALKAAATEKLKALGKGGLRNDDTGWTLTVSKKDRSKLVDWDGNSDATLQALGGIDGLVRHAVLAESHEDHKHKNPDVQAIHRLYAPVEIGGQLYRAKLTVRDYTGPRSGDATKLYALEAIEIEGTRGDSPTTGPALQTLETGKLTSPGRAISVAALLAGATRNDGSAWQGDDALFQFAGPSSKTADQHALITAQQRLAAGEDAEAVRRETGWHVGADGKWRYEISDADARLLRKTSNPDEFANVFEEAAASPEGVPLSRVLHHPALFAAYPRLGDVRVVIDDAMNGDGAYYPASNTIKLHSPDGYRGGSLRFLSVLLHEIQHGIQAVEGFASGGSIEGMAALMPSSPVDGYRRLAGEVEARNTQARAEMTDAERAATPPEQTADVAARDVIVVFNGTEMASAPQPANAAPAAPRAAFSPSTNTIALLKGADLSSFLHEAGHAFLEMSFDMAARLDGAQREGAGLSEGELQVLADANALLRWFGVADFNEWYGMDFEARRALHERFAESFEAYLFSGKAPSIELQPVFQRFRAWLLSVYKSLKAFLEGHPEAGKLSDEVRGVFDRMLASTEQIKLMEQAQSMLPLFSSMEEAQRLGVVLDWAHYQALGLQPTLDAIDELQARGLSDMQWLRGARARVLRRLQRQAAEQRREVRMEARAEILQQPVYKAWQFLTGKITEADKLEAPAAPKSTAGGLDAANDSLLVAIAKLGGIARESARTDLGVAADDLKRSAGVFGKPPFRKEGGLTAERMAEALQEQGYLPSDYTLHDLEERIDAELSGNAQFSDAHDYAADAAAQRRPGEGYNLGGLAAGRLDLTELRALGLPPEMLEALQKRRMTAKDGIHPDLVAELDILRGDDGAPAFTSGDHLARALAAAQPLGEAIEARTDALMLERYGDLATPQAIEQAADAAIHNEARARVIATEQAALARAVSGREQTGTTKQGRPVTQAIVPRAAREFAQQLIARLRIRDIRPGQYDAAEARAARNAEKASRAGDVATAAAEKRNQLIQHYSTKAAYDAQEDVERGLRYLRGFDREGTRKSLPPDYLEQIEALLEKFDLRRVSDKQQQRTASLRTWVLSRLKAGEVPDIAETLLLPHERAAYLAEVQSRDADKNLVYADDEDAIRLLADAIDRSARRSYKDATVEEFRGLVDTIKQIEHLGRIKGKLLTAREQRSYEQVRDELAAGIAAHAEGGKNRRTANDWLGQKLQAIRQFGASHIKVATWARIMDGGQDGGPVWEYLIRPANERATQETTMRAQATEALDEILRPILAKVPALDKVGKGRFFPSIGDSLNWQERFAVLLNMGNESNMQRLLGGKGWSLEQIKPVLDMATAEEWCAAQAVWDHFETYRPLIAEKELRVSGREPQWIQARPLTVRTADGQEVRLRGGYYPVVFDPRVNLESSKNSDAEDAKALLRAANRAATTRRSFVKSRVEEVTGRPLLLNLQGLYSGVNDVIHDLAWHEWVIDANKLLRSKTVDEAVREHYGPEVKKEFEKWRDDIVAGSRRLDHAIERAAGFVRQNVSAAALGFNLLSVVQQPLGLANSIARVGATWIGRGVARYASSPIESTREAQEKSEWLRGRTRTRFRELNELRNQVQGQTAAREWMGRYAYWLMARAQLMVDVPTWWGAYEKAVAEGRDEDMAVALADQAVKDSQGGGEEVDQSGIERGGPLVKLFTSFYGFMGTTLNTAVLTATTERSRAKAAVNLLLVLSVPALLGDLLKDALTPGGGDDDEGLVKKLLAAQLSFLLGLVAFGREFAPAVKALMGVSSPGYSGPAGLRLVPDSIRLAQQTGQALFGDGEFDDSFRKAFVNVLGDLTGAPSVQFNRTVTGAEALAEGETANPAALVFGFQKQ